MRRDAWRPPLACAVPRRLARKLIALKSAPTHANTIGICWIFVEIRRGCVAAQWRVVDLACAHDSWTINNSGDVSMLMDRAGTAGTSRAGSTTSSAGRNCKLRESNWGARIAHRIGKVRGASHELLIPECGHGDSPGRGPGGPPRRAPWCARRCCYWRRGGCGRRPMPGRYPAGQRLIRVRRVNHRQLRRSRRKCSRGRRCGRGE
jgi:hypothetical protein